MIDRPGVLIGGQPVVTLTSPSAEGVVQAQIAPGRGMMLLGAQGRLKDGPLVDLVEAPSLEGAAARLDGGPADFAGNAAFSFGGAILLPYANRIRGTPSPDRRVILADLGSARVELPRNWGGKAPGAPEYAMHGLILDLPAPHVEQAAPDRVRGRVVGWDFAGRWPSRVDLDLDWRLAGGALELCVTATNSGDAILPMGVGWHPYFKVLSGQREQVRLQVPARRRLRVGDYDAVLPTGRIDAVAGTPYDFTGAEGAALGDLYLDDTFVDLTFDPQNPLTLRIIDPAAGCEVRLTSPTRELRAVQVYAPTEQPVVVVEPQYNLVDPFWPGWAADVDTGMIALAPGQSTAYRVRTQFLPL